MLSVYELLPAEVKQTFTAAVEALRERLQPARREALTSTRLMKRRQKDGETVDAYAQEFERLCGSSYGQRAGMDPESKDLLKRDLFVQGLRMKWQEKVLPSAETFTDALYQARVAEEQERQLAELHMEVHPVRSQAGRQTERPPSAKAGQLSHGQPERVNRKEAAPVRSNSAGDARRPRHLTCF